MRTIKCRGKALFDDEWVYGYYYNQDDSRKGEKRHIILYETDGPGMTTIREPIDVKTLGQDTGLKDKCGKEIHEGDICRVSGNENYSNLYITTDYDWEYTMNVSGEGYAYKFIDTEDKYFHIYLDEAENMLVEIIGNIFENPELLEEK